jgi:hypothetical protein
MRDRQTDIQTNRQTEKATEKTDVPPSHALILLASPPFRTAEAYGEDPTLISAMGVTATRALQNRSANGFLMTSQVTRHFLGYHGANGV